MESKNAAKELLTNLAYQLENHPSINLVEDGTVFLVETSGIFDPAYYLANNPDVAANGMRPSLHFIKFGWKEGRLPSTILDENDMKLSYELENFKQFINILKEKYNAPEESNKILLRSGSYESLYDMPMFVNWSITNMCNYSCSYCFGQDKIDMKKFTSFNKLMNAVDNLASLERNLYNFTLSGGEPTIHPQFLNLLYFIKNRIGSRIDAINIITNGSQSIDFYNQIVEIAESTPMNLIISIHTDHVHPEHIYELIKTLQGHVHLNFSLMYNPMKFSLVKEIFSNLCTLRKDNYFKMQIVPLREPPTFSELDRRYTPELNEWLDNAQKEFNTIAVQSKGTRPQLSGKAINYFHEILDKGSINTIRGRDGISLYREGLMNFKGMYCITGTHLLRIKPRGSFSGAICAATKFKGDIFERGALKNNDFCKIIQCPLNGCGCRSNDPLMKFRDLKDAEIYFHSICARQDALRKN